MNWFGMTYIAGPHNSISAQSVKSLNMDDFDIDQFNNAFELVDEDKSGYISLDELRIVLGQVYQDTPPENEVKFLMDLFDKNKDGKITREEWNVAIPLLKEQRLHQDQDTASEFKSAKAYRHALKSSAPLRYNPIDKYRRPITSSQEYGWYTPLPVEKVPTKNKKSCPETMYASEMIRAGMM